jgi:hypothetical protein
LHKYPGKTAVLQSEIALQQGLSSHYVYFDGGNDNGDDNDGNYQRG